MAYAPAVLLPPEKTENVFYVMTGASSWKFHTQKMDVRNGLLDLIITPRPGGSDNIRG